MNQRFFRFDLRDWVRLFVSLVLLGPGLLHLSDFASFYQAILAYDVFPPQWVPYFATWVPLLQVTLAVFLLLRVWVEPSLIVGGMLLLAFGFVGAMALVAKKTISCGCFGALSPMLSWWHVAGTTGLAMVCFGASRPRKSFSKRSQQKRRPRLARGATGFTLVELLCVIALIGILTGMLLPAVQQVREAARNIHCRNNLKQLSLAVQNYESAHKKLPPGTLGYQGTVWVNASSDHPAWLNDPSYPYYVFRNQNTSWLAAILPQIERSDLYDQLPRICFNTSQTYEFYRNQTAGPERIFEIPEVAFVMEKKVPLFQCPSDGVLTTGSVTGGTQPVFDLDGNVDGYLYFEVPSSATSSNYSGCSGAYSGGHVPAPEMEIYDGIFGSRIQKRLSEVTDGTSQSILAGEQLGLISNRERTFSSSWLFQTLARARSDLAWKSLQTPRFPGLELLGDEWFAHAGGFGSMHPTTVNFAMIDGSVRPIRRSIDWQTLYSLAGIHDRDLITE